MRYYTNANGLHFRTIEETLRHLFVIVFNKKTKKHTFRYIDYVVGRNRNLYRNDPNDEIVTFTNIEHENEFINYHPDARRLPITAVVNDIDIPIHFVNGRWLWRK